MNPRIRTAVSSWLRRYDVQLQNSGDDEFTRFFISYMCLDAIMTDGSQEDADHCKLEWLIGKENVLKRAFSDGGFDKSSLIGLENLSPVRDMRPGHSHKVVKLNPEPNFEEVMRFIYQIRCNFFHGGKSDQDDRDRSLVAHAGQFLMNWLRYVVGVS